MKFVHIADVHFDMPFTSIRYSKKIINQRRIDARNIFYNTINFVKESGVDMFFISGDLFEQRFVENDTINFIISCLKTIPNTKIFIAPGNHDPLIASSPYNTYDWPENVIIFTGEVQRFDYDDVSVYGFGFTDFEMDEDLIKDIKVDEDKINILVAHGTLDGAMHKYNDMKNRDLKKFDYVALGHIHLPKIDDSRMIYPGSLVAGGLDEQGEHGLVIGEIDKTNCNIEFKRMDNREFKEVELHLTLEDETKTANEIVENLNLEDDIYRIILTGRRIASLPQLIDALNDLDKFICDIKDETEMPYDLQKIAGEETLKGMFTRKMMKLLEAEPEREEEIKKAIEIAYKNM